HRFQLLGPLADPQLAPDTAERQRKKTVDLAGEVNAPCQAGRFGERQLPIQHRILQPVDVSVHKILDAAPSSDDELILLAAMFHLVPSVDPLSYRRLFHSLRSPASSSSLCASHSI